MDNKYVTYSFFSYVLKELTRLSFYILCYSYCLFVLYFFQFVDKFLDGDQAEEEKGDDEKDEVDEEEEELGT